MSEAELTCRDLVELVTDYLEGALPAGDRARFEEHIDECAACATYLDQMRETIRLLGLLGEESILPEAKDQLLAVFRDWTRA